VTGRRVVKVRPFTEKQTACFARVASVWPHAYVECAVTSALHRGAMRGLVAAGLVSCLFTNDRKRSGARFQVWRLTPGGSAWHSRQLLLFDRIP
jgi:hypothetical protein